MICNTQLLDKCDKLCATIEIVPLLLKLGFETTTSWDHLKMHSFVFTKISQLPKLKFLHLLKFPGIYSLSLVISRDIKLPDKYSLIEYNIKLRKLTLIP